MQLLFYLRSAIENPELSEEDEITGRYAALVYTIMHHFIDLRTNAAHGVPVPIHVLPTMDLLIGKSKIEIEIKLKRRDMRGL